MTDWLDRAQATWNGAGMEFSVETRSGHTVLLDASLEHGGSNRGPTPMEAVLVGLAGCTGMDVISMLRKMRQDVTRYEVKIRDRREDEHPRTFKEIEVLHIIHGRGVDPAAVERAVNLSESKYCSVSAALSSGCPVRHEFQIVPSDGA